MWNLCDLPYPAEDICEYPPQGSSSVETFRELISILNEGADILTGEDPIWSEISILRNIQAKYKRILHCDKCLQLLQRVGRCLRKIILLNLSKSYLDLAERFVIALQDLNAVLFLPSRQQLEYLLIRTQSTARLICESLQYSKETFCYLLQKLRVGHMVLDLVMATSVTARLHIMLKGIFIQICNLYKKLRKCLPKLKRGTWKWASPLELPKDLKSWLKPQFLGIVSSVSNTQINILAAVFQNERNESDADSVVEVAKDDEPAIAIANNSMEMDYGEVVTRKPIEKPPQQLKESQKSLIWKIFKANTLKKLSTLWDNINIYSEDLRPLVLTKNKIAKITNLLDALKTVKGSKGLSCSKKAKDTLVTNIIGFRFAKHLNLVKTREEYSNVVKSFLNKQTEDAIPTFIAVKKMKELKQMHKDMCKSLNDEEKCEKLTQYFKGQRTTIRNLRKKDEKALAKKLTYYTSKVLITMYKAQ